MLIRDMTTYKPEWEGEINILCLKQSIHSEEPGEEVAHSSYP